MGEGGCNCTEIRGGGVTSWAVGTIDQNALLCQVCTNTEMRGLFCTNTPLQTTSIKC